MNVRFCVVALRRLPRSTLASSVEQSRTREMLGISSEVRHRSNADHTVSSASFGVLSGGETPVPIPNTAVKPTSADGSLCTCRGKSRPMPVYVKSRT